MTTPLLSYGFAKRHGVVLLSLDQEAVIALREGSSPAALVEVRRALGAPLIVKPMSAATFDRTFSQAYAGAGLASASSADSLDLEGGLGLLLDDMPTAADLLDPQDDAPIIRLINGLIAEAVRLGASDIHIEPFEQALVVRLRIDGVLREVLSLSPRIAAMLVSRVKVMAKLDIAEKRLP
ncbi:MAG: Flp pilus assembly complex ATPase component TadA, partial [Caulobacter sp.]|nr:Flp pilus assembly complex ATPase component TadA [Caulobacter sp.]